MNTKKSVILYYAMAIKIGAIGEQEQPIKMKKTLGCRSYSVLQLGIRLIKQAYSRSKQFFDSLIIKLFKLHFVQPTSSSVTSVYAPLAPRLGNSRYYHDFDSINSSFTSSIYRLRSIVPAIQFS
ncbi:hypothetical protein [Candidatus Tisiphia endosymbiont of Ptychoptera albimana]|uniref:hypothetical protein n=1 Tax=Candidatus Tisiphia endosymbiont of Ptychoptera albimana TaxID=3066260 RepID=UPI00312CACF8